MYSKVMLFLIKLAVVPSAVGTFLLVEATAQSLLPFWLGLVTVPGCMIITGSLFLLSLQKTIKKPAMLKMQKVKTDTGKLVYLQNNKPTAC